MKSNDQPKMSAEQVQVFLDSDFPEANFYGKTYEILSVTTAGADVMLLSHERHLRPGGTISGPAMMALVDVAAYVGLLGNIGPVALAVTTNLSISFVRKPEPGHLIASCEIIKLGRRLAVLDVRIRSEGSEAIVAQASVTYAIPQE
ncbi:MAG: PaaI family thioesterase [Rhizobiales bacterium]|nr:PaaI family thioesterase [Hyphomicrobiales bacterium]